MISSYECDLIDTTETSNSSTDEYVLKIDVPTQPAYKGFFIQGGGAKVSTHTLALIAQPN